MGVNGEENKTLSSGGYLILLVRILCEHFSESVVEAETLHAVWNPSAAASCS